MNFPFATLEDLAEMDYSPPQEGLFAHQHHEQESNGTVEMPGVNDVLCGRGGLSNNNRANIRFRELIDSYRVSYTAASRQAKPRVSEYVVKLWKSQQPPGRFLSKTHHHQGSGNGKKSCWVWTEVSDNMAKKKVSQCLRARRVPRGEDSSSADGNNDTNEKALLFSDEISSTDKVRDRVLIRATMVPKNNSDIIQTLNGRATSSSSNSSSAPQLVSLSSDGSGTSSSKNDGGSNTTLPPLPSQVALQLQQQDPLLSGFPPLLASFSAPAKEPTTTFESLETLLSGSQHTDDPNIPSTVSMAPKKRMDRDDNFLFPQSSFCEMMASASGASTTVASSNNLFGSSTHSNHQNHTTNSHQQQQQQQQHNNLMMDGLWEYQQQGFLMAAHEIPCAAAITASVFDDDDW